MIKAALKQLEVPVHIYYVTGYGEFPFDMLRVGQAWPDRPTDAAKLSRHDKERSIRLVGCKPPSVDLWTQAGWRVGDKDLVT